MEDRNYRYLRNVKINLFPPSVPCSALAQNDGTLIYSPSWTDIKCLLVGLLKQLLGLDCSSIWSGSPEDAFLL